MAILGYLHFLLNFRNRLSISVKKKPGILTELVFIDQFGKIRYFVILRPLVHEQSISLYLVMFSFNDIFIVFCI